MPHATCTRPTTCIDWTHVRLMCCQYSKNNTATFCLWHCVSRRKNDHVTSSEKRPKPQEKSDTKTQLNIPCVSWHLPAHLYTHAHTHTHTSHTDTHNHANRSDPRVIGMAPWHWQHCGGCAKSRDEIGVRSMNRTKTAWRDIGQKIKAGQDG